MRLIDADVIFPYAKKLEDLAQKRVWDTPTNSPCYQRYRTQYTEREEFRKIVENSPTIDAVPVIRCKDCKHYRNHPNGLCYLWTEEASTAKGYKGDAHCVEANDFCSYGERKCADDS